MRSVGALATCVVAWLMLHLTGTPRPVAAAGGSSGNRVWKSRAAAAEEKGMTKPAIRMAYELMDTMNPFPCSSMEQKKPLMWKLSSALGRAASLHPSCMFVYTMMLVALTLNAVQVKYSGLLGRFSNILLLQAGLKTQRPLPLRWV